MILLFYFYPGVRDQTVLEVLEPHLFLPCLCPGHLRIFAFFFLVYYISMRFRFLSGYLAISIILIFPVRFSCLLFSGKKERMIKRIGHLGRAVRSAVH